MFTRKNLIGLGAVALLVALSFGVVVAQTTPGHGTPATTAKEVSLQGKIVDLHCFMTSDTPPVDAKKCAECIKAGVPAALDTATGLVMLGHGAKGPADACAAHAGQDVTVKGKLYEKAGVKYLEIETIEAQTAAAGAHTGTNPS